MRVENLEFNPDNARKSLAEQRKVYFETKFNFIRQHNGIRPNKLHLFIAPSGVGKSSVTQALIDDLILKNKEMKILLYLTEESKEDFRNAMTAFTYNHKEINQRVHVMREDITKSEKEIKDSLETALFHNDYDLVILDNITTSKLYPDNVREQTNTSVWLKSLLPEAALYVIAHTSKNNHNSEMLDETSIRGCKTISNLAEFLYVLQPVRINSSLFQFIRLIKHRGQHPKEKFFKVVFDQQLKAISGDKISSFDDFKEIFKLRNKL